eukprot:ANDGO_04949.mRNA.1 hypothetical protein
MVFLLKSLSVRNFLSFGNVMQTIELSKINSSLYAFVTGSHNSGKSNVVRAIRFLLYHIPTPVRASEVPTPHWDAEMSGDSVFLSVEFAVRNSQVRQMLIDVYLLTLIDFPLPSEYDDESWEEYLEAISYFWRTFYDTRSKLMDDHLLDFVRFSYSSDSQEQGLLEMHALTGMRKRLVNIGDSLEFVRVNAKAISIAEELGIDENLRHVPLSFALLHQSLGDLAQHEQRVLSKDEEGSGSRKGKGRSGTVSIFSDMDDDSSSDVSDKGYVSVRSMSHFHSKRALATESGPHRAGLRKKRSSRPPKKQSIRQEELKRILRNVSRFLTDYDMTLDQFSLLKLLCAISKNSVAILPQDRGLFKTSMALPYEITFERARQVLYDLKFSSVESDRDQFAFISKKMEAHLKCSIEFMMVTQISKELQLVFSEGNKNMYSVQDTFGAAYDLCAAFVAMYACNATTMILDEPGRGAYANLRNDIRELLISMKDKAILVVTNEFDLLPTRDKPFQCVWRVTRENGRSLCINAESVVDSLRLARFVIEPSRRQLLFSHAVIMCEGQHDYRFLTALNHILKSSDFNKGGWSRCSGLKSDILPLGGKSGAQSAMRLVREFHMRGVCLLDWDAVIKRPYIPDKMLNDARITDILRQCESIFQSIHSGSKLSDSEEFLAQFDRVRVGLITLNTGLGISAVPPSPCIPLPLTASPKGDCLTEDEKNMIWASIPSEIAFKVASEVMGVPDAVLKEFKQFPPWSSEAITCIRETLMKSNIFVWGPEAPDMEGVMNYKRSVPFHKAEWSEYSFDDDVKLVLEALQIQTSPDSPLMCFYNFLLQRNCLMLLPDDAVAVVPECPLESISGSTKLSVAASDDSP